METDCTLLAEGKYFLGNKQEAQLGVVLLALARGFHLGEWVEEKLDPDAVFPVMAALLQDLTHHELEQEANSAAGHLTLFHCGPDHVFGYMPSEDAWGVWPI